MNFIRRLLTHKWLPAFLAAIAILLVLPSIWTGWQLDDITHRYFLLGYQDFQGRTWSPLELFSFLKGDSVRTHGMMDLGLLPWWTVDGLRLSFWRPLTGLTHWLDYALWPNNAVLMHVQNLFWLGALVAVVGLLYRRFLGLTWVAGFAALLYAIDDAHGLPAGWLAGRNTVIAALFGMVVLLVHDRWRRNGWRSGAWVGPICLALGLLAGEYALSAVAYLVAYAFFLDRESRRDRVLSLVPYGSILLIWLIVYHQLGHGTWGSGFYVDPISEPMAFVAAFFERAPILLLDQFSFPPAAIYLVLSQNQLMLLWIWALVVLVVLALVLLPLVRRDATARFWATGLLLSLPLICATLPSGRLLFFVGIGAMGLVAQWFGAYTGGASWLGQTRVWRLGGKLLFVVLVVVHIVIGPLLLPWNSTSAAVAEPYLQRAAESLPNTPEITRKELILVNPPVVFYSNYVAPILILNDAYYPKRLRALAPGSTALNITRTNEFTLTIQPDGGYLASPFDNVFRGPAYPMKVGERVELTGMSVRVTNITDDGRPEKVAFEFNVPLEDSSLMWLQWKDGRYVSFKIPPVDSITILPPAVVF